MSDKQTYPGYWQDGHGITLLGRVVLDAWVFGFLPDDEDCAGWELSRMQLLMHRVENEWDRHGNLPSRLPEALAERHRQIYARAMKHASQQGWSAELQEDE